MMNLEEIVQQLGFNPVSIFKEIVSEQFFGRHIFEWGNERYYEFTPEEAGDAVWITKAATRESPYQVLRVEASNKFPQGQIVPGLVSLYHCKRINENWIDDRKHSRIQNEIRNGGTELSVIANCAFLDVLKTSVIDEHKIETAGHQLKELLPKLFADFRKQGFRLDTFIFPEHLRALLIQKGIIIPDTKIQHNRYVGETISGQRAFWVSEMLDDIAFIVASKVGFTLIGDLEVNLVRDISSGWPALAVCGYLDLNPIIKERRGVLLIEGIEERLTNQPIEVAPLAKAKPDIMYVDSERLDELRIISSKVFDLKKLIRLCEELNTSWNSKSFFATIFLIRSILDHVPPIFSLKNFSEVANNYNGGGTSFKSQMQRLENSSRKIADRYLHGQIRKSESLPNQTEVNFSNDLDSLLGEIIRILK